MVKINSLVFSYQKENRIFTHFCEEFKKGERICLRGSSGKGKTTLLKLIAGFEKPQSGSVTVLDGLKISYSFQEDDLFPWYTALKNVSVVSNEKKAKEILCRMGLEESLNKLPSELSGGMKKRVSLARAMAFDYDILLIDEGFVGIEKELQKSIADYLLESSQNKLIIFSSHDDFISDYLSTRVVNI